MNSRVSTKKQNVIGPKRKKEVRTSVQRMDNQYKLEIPIYKPRHIEKLKFPTYSGIQSYELGYNRNVSRKMSTKKHKITHENDYSLPAIYDKHNISSHKDPCPIIKPKTSLKQNQIKIIDVPKRYKKSELTESESKMYGKRFPLGYKKIGFLGKYYNLSL